MKKILVLIFVLPIIASAECVSGVKIGELKPRVEGWIHIVAEGVSDMDVKDCGVNNHNGMLLNFNDSSGTTEGKQMMLSIVLSAYMTGKTMDLCSSGCDSQHPSYSRLDSINNLSN